MTEDDYVTITKAEYRELVGDRMFLNTLLDFGVSEWEGYEIAYDDYYAKEINV